MAALSPAYTRKTSRFKYIYIHRVLPTQERLHLWKPSCQPTCIACGQYPDTFEHVFRKCPKAKSLLKPMKRLLSTTTVGSLPSNSDLLFSLSQFVVPPQLLSSFGLQFPLATQGNPRSKTNSRYHRVPTAPKDIDRLAYVEMTLPTRRGMVAS